MDLSIPRSRRRSRAFSTTVLNTPSAATAPSTSVSITAALMMITAVDEVPSRGGRTRSPESFASAAAAKVSRFVPGAVRTW